MKNEYVPHELKEIFFFILLGLIMAIVIPVFFGFALGGFTETFVKGRAVEFSDILFQYMIYYIIILVGIIGLPLLKLIELLIVKRINPVGEHPNPSIWLVFGTPFLHDPESKGFIYNLFDYFGESRFMKWSLSILRVLIISIIIFGFIGVFQLAFRFSFVGSPQKIILQQLTPLGQVFFNAEPPAFAETTLMLFIFSILMGVVNYICSKFKLGRWAFFLIGLLIISPVIGLLWGGYHNIVYGNSAEYFWRTVLFGILGAQLTLLFGTFIFWYIWHFMNNWFAKLLELITTNEDLFILTIIGLILLTISYISIEVLIYKYKKKKREYEPTTP